MNKIVALSIAAAIVVAGSLYFALSAPPTLAQNVSRCALPTSTPTPTPVPNAPTPTPLPATAGTIPVFPMSFSGTATLVGGASIPDCTFMYAKVGESVSAFVPIVGGVFRNLTIAAEDSSAHDQMVTFHLAEDVVAAETETYFFTQSPPDPPTHSFKAGFSVTFPNLVTPTATPTNTPVPPRPGEPTPLPSVDTPTPTPTPLTAEAAIYLGGTIIVAGGLVPEGAQLVARIGDDYTSLPALIQGQQYVSLVVDPGSSSFIGRSVEFYLNDVKASTSDTFESGAVRAGFLITFVGFPTPVPTDTPTPIPPTATPVPPTATLTPVPTDTPTPVPTDTPTPVPPTATPIPPTATPIPPDTPTPTPTLRPTRTPVPELPTATPAPPTSTPAPTATPAPPTSTPAPTATATPEPSGGFLSCNRPGSSTPTPSAAANLLLLAAPLGAAYAARRFRRPRP